MNNVILPHEVPVRLTFLWNEPVTNTILAPRRRLSWGEIVCNLDYTSLKNHSCRLDKYNGSNQKCETIFPG